MKEIFSSIRTKFNFKIKLFDKLNLFTYHGLLKNNLSKQTKKMEWRGFQ